MTLKKRNKLNFSLSDKELGECSKEELIELVKNQQALEDELENHRKRVAHSERFASLGLLASGIGHEINNPLGVIKGMNYFVKNIAQQDKPLSREQLDDILNKVDVIDDCVGRISEIVDGLRTMARCDTEHMNPVNAHTYIEKTVGIVRELYSKEGIQIYLHLDCENPYFLGNFGKFQQIIMNLISNAKDALEGEVDAQIHIRSWDEQGQIHISVADTGCGIPLENQKKIFDTFFTTKDVGKGTGMGLSLTSSLVEEMGGGIDFTSSEKGTTFYLKFPLSTVKPEENIEIHTNIIHHKLSGKVLIVEDEDLLRELTIKLLESFGLDVDEASNGHEALEKVRQNEYDILVTDLKMPRMSGIDLLYYLRKEGLDSELKVAVITGGVATSYSKEKRDELRDYIDEYIKKPFDSEEIYRKMKWLLEN